MAMADEMSEAAALAGLVHVTDEVEGLRRRRRGRGFSLHRADGSLVVDQAVLDRVAALAIPPAWTDVWVCPDPDGHLQATGRDARGRKQYRYHPRWREVRDADKFDRLAVFGTQLPALRRHVDKMLRRPGLDEERVLAAVLRLLDESLIRVGNREYAEDNESYGVTTLAPKHARAGATHVSLCFVGKGGKEHSVELDDPRLARVVRRCHELGGKQLFAYRADDGTVRGLSSSDVNRSLHELVAPGASAKDFRTWGASVLVAEHLAGASGSDDQDPTEQRVLEAIDVAAGVLGNTRAVCRSCYVHPAVPEAYATGELAERWGSARATRWMTRPERVVLALLKARAAPRRRAA